MIQHALGQSLHPRQTHIPAPSKSSGTHSCLLCGVESWALLLQSFLLVDTAAELPTSLWTQDSCSTQMCVCVCLLVYLSVCLYVHVIYCSAAAGSSPATGFSTCDSGGIRYWTSSVLMATLSGWSHLLKCSKVLEKSKRKGNCIRPG